MLGPPAPRHHVDTERRDLLQDLSPIITALKAMQDSPHCRRLPLKTLQRLETARRELLTFLDESLAVLERKPE